MDYKNVFCFPCKTQCTEIAERFRVEYFGKEIYGVQCPKCRTIYTESETVDGRTMKILEMMEEENEN